MSEEINILLQAQDMASSVISGASDEIDSSLSGIQKQAETTSTQLSTHMNSASNAVDDSSTSLKDNAYAMAGVTSGAASLVVGISKVENSQTSLDKAHVTLERNTNAVTTAQENYNKAVAKYGQDSPQAVDAANKLKTAQDALKVSHERVDEAQRNVNNSMLMFGVSVIPTTMTMVSGISTLIGNFPGIAGAMSSATEGISTAMDFLAENPIILVITGIALLAAGLVYAYDHCKPFRDAINEIGSVLGGGLKTAVTDIYNAFYWLWNNVLVPIGNFLTGVFLTAINTITGPITTIVNAIKTITGAASSIGGVIGNALHSIGLATGGIVNEPTLALIGEAGPEAVVPLGANNSSILGTPGISPLNTVDRGAATYNISIPISIEGNVDQRTLAVIRQELRNVVVEATSQNAPATQKRIRSGSTF